jgi:hypothetical protein
VISAWRHGTLQACPPVAFRGIASPVFEARDGVHRAFKPRPGTIASAPEISNAKGKGLVDTPDRDGRGAAFRDRTARRGPLSGFGAMVGR